MVVVFDLGHQQFDVFESFTCCIVVPLILTIGPRQFRCHGFEEEEETYGDDDIVVDGD